MSSGGKIGFDLGFECSHLSRWQKLSSKRPRQTSEWSSRPPQTETPFDCSIAYSARKDPSARIASRDGSGSMEERQSLRFKISPTFDTTHTKTRSTVFQPQPTSSSFLVLLARWLLPSALSRPRAAEYSQDCSLFDSIQLAPQTDTQIRSHFIKVRVEARINVPGYLLACCSCSPTRPKAFHLNTSTPPLNSSTFLGFHSMQKGRAHQAQPSYGTDTRQQPAPS